VKVILVDDQGRIKLSIKQAKAADAAAAGGATTQAEAKPAPAQVGSQV
jgi:predicted RNA-binding protein with RPS1 domain